MQLRKLFTLHWWGFSCLLSRAGTISDDRADHGGCERSQRRRCQRSENHSDQPAGVQREATTMRQAIMLSCSSSRELSRGGTKGGIRQDDGGKHHRPHHRDN